MTDIEDRPAPAPEHEVHLDSSPPQTEPTAEDLALGTVIEDLGENHRLLLEGLEQADELGILTSAQAERMVQLAAGQVGVRESDHEDRGIPLIRYVQWFVPGSGPQPWCAFFASWCWDRATDSNHQVPWSPGSTRSVYDWAARVGRLVSRPQRGDFYVYANFNHMGIVESVSGSTFRTIDGNWSDAVTRTSRTIGTSFRYIRLP
jgi:hypothetical protein